MEEMDEPGSTVDALEVVAFRRVVGRTTASSARSLLWFEVSAAEGSFLRSRT